MEGERREARVSELVKAGKVKPAEKASILDFAARLAAQTDTVDFAAPDGTKEKIAWKNAICASWKPGPWTNGRTSPRLRPIRAGDDPGFDYDKMASKL